MKNKDPGYKILPDNAFVNIKNLGTNPRSGMPNNKLVAERRPFWDVESLYITNTDGLIGILDGTIGRNDDFGDPNEIIQETDFEGEATDYAIYLDKSARPIRKLVHELWPLLAREGSKEPSAKFLNIDKERWLIAMGFDKSKVQKIDPTKISLDRIDDGYLHKMLTTIRALFVDEGSLSQVDEENLESVWGMPTIFDGKNVTIIDEVKSSGNTLRIALMLLRSAIPEARYCAAYWAAPPLVQWQVLADGEMSTEFCMSYVPVWYDDKTSKGRGIDDIDPRFSRYSKSKTQRIGAHILGTPYHNWDTLELTSPDRMTLDVHHDLSLLVQRAYEKRAFIVPSVSRRFDDFQERATSLNGITFEEFVNRQKSRE